MKELPYMKPNCTNCSLLNCTSIARGLGENQFVFGVGNSASPKYMIIGEAPGREELVMGIPFVGDSGKLLKKVLTLHGVNLSDCYFTNANLCRPEENRTPKWSEIVACNSRLKSEIQWVNPQKILLLGSTACQALYGKSAKITEYRGAYRTYENIPVLCTFHPSAVLRSPANYIDFEADIRKLIFSEKAKDYTVELESKPLTIITTTQQAIEFLSSVDTTKPTVIDIETLGTNVREGFIKLIGLYNEEIGPVIIHYEAVGGYPEHPITELFGKYLEAVPLIAHNGPFEYVWLKENFYCNPNIIDDTLLAHYTLDERAGDDDYGGKVRAHSLKVLGAFHFDIPKWDVDHSKDVMAEELYEYLWKDLYATWGLLKIFHAQLQSAGLFKVYRDMLVKFIPMIADMHLKGICVDPKALDEVEAEIDEQIEHHTSYIYANSSIKNVRSPNQLNNYLYTELGLKKLFDKKTKKWGGTGKMVLEKLSILYPDQLALGHIFHARRFMSIKSNFIKGVRKYSATDGMIHCWANLAGAATGRWSWREPNMSNAPIREPNKCPKNVPYKKINFLRIFIPHEGHEFLKWDYAQLEPRILAGLSGDENLIQLFKDGRDLYREAAAFHYGCTPAEVTKEQRQEYKTVILAISYLMSAETLSEDYFIPLQDAEQRIESFYRMFPKVREYNNRMFEEAKAKAYVETHFGKRRRFYLQTSGLYAEIGRQAANSPVQGTASDINAISADAVHDNDELFPEVLFPLLLIHDAGLCDLKLGGNYRSMAIEFLKKTCEVEFMGVPLKIEIDCGPSWGEMENVA